LFLLRFRKASKAKGDSFSSRDADDDGRYLIFITKRAIRPSGIAFLAESRRNAEESIVAVRGGVICPPPAVRL
jgi:hypothetical protein